MKSEKKRKSRNLLNYYNNCRLGHKILIAFILGAIIPILIIQKVSYNLNSNYMTQKANELTQNNLLQIAERTRLTLEIYTNLLYQIYVDDDISKNIDLLLDENVTSKAAAYNQLYNRMKQYNRSNQGIRCVSIVCPDGVAVTYDYKTGSTLDTLWSGTKDMKYIQPYVDAKDSLGMVITPTTLFKDHGEEKYFFHISKRIFDLNNLEKGTIATAFMSIDANILNDICKSQMDEENKNISEITFILNEKRQVISYPKAMFLGITLDEKLSMNDFIKISGMLKNKDIVINEYHDPKTGWIFYSAYDKDYLLKDMRSSKDKLLSLDIGLIMISILLITYTVRNINSSIKGVIHGIHQVKSGNLNVIVPVKHKDEIGQIAGNFNEMTAEVIRLIHEVKSATDRQKNAEIKALEAQINPHFLYNTLDSINWMAIDKGEYEISKMLCNLGNILRYSVNKSNQMVRIEEEGEWLVKYITLQKMRFNDAFDFLIHIDESIMNVKVYKLLLQPFIENSIIHGFSGLEQGGMINIDIIPEKDGKRICFIIEDNGIGMEQEILKEFNDRECAIHGDEFSIGLHNAFSRMVMYYGDLVEWNLNSIKGMGTVVTIKLPISV